MSKHLSMDVRVPIEEGNNSQNRKSLYQMRTVSGRMSETDFRRSSLRSFKNR